jgi:hypothetical protein
LHEAHHRVDIVTIANKSFGKEFMKAVIGKDKNTAQTIFNKVQAACEAAIRKTGATLDATESMTHVQDDGAGKYTVTQGAP